MGPCSSAKISLHGGSKYIGPRRVEVEVAPFPQIGHTHILIFFFGTKKPTKTEQAEPVVFELWFVHKLFF